MVVHKIHIVRYSLYTGPWTMTGKQMSWSRKYWKFHNR